MGTARTGGSVLKQVAGRSVTMVVLSEGFERMWEVNFTTDLSSKHAAIEYLMLLTPLQVVCNELILLYLDLLRWAEMGDMSHHTQLLKGQAGACGGKGCVVLVAHAV